MIAEELIVGSVFLDDVDHVPDRIACRAGTRSRRCVPPSGCCAELLREFLLIALGFCQAYARERAANQRRNVWVGSLARMLGILFPARVRSCALTFAGRYQQFIAVNRQRRRIPLGGNEMRRSLGGRAAFRPRLEPLFVEPDFSPRHIKHRYRIRRRIRHVQLLPIRRLRQRIGIRPAIGLPQQARIKILFNLPIFSRRSPQPHRDSPAPHTIAIHPDSTTSPSRAMRARYSASAATVKSFVPPFLRANPALLLPTHSKANTRHARHPASPLPHKENCWEQGGHVPAETVAEPARSSHPSAQHRPQDSLRSAADRRRTASPPPSLRDTDWLFPWECL